MHIRLPDNTVQMGNFYLRAFGVSGELLAGGLVLKTETLASLYGSCQGHALQQGEQVSHWARMSLVRLSLGLQKGSRQSSTIL